MDQPKADQAATTTPAPEVAAQKHKGWETRRARAKAKAEAAAAKPEQPTPEAPKAKRKRSPNKPKPALTLTQRYQQQLEMRLQAVFALEALSPAERAEIAAAVGVAL